MDPGCPSPWPRLIGLIDSSLGFALRQLDQPGLEGNPRLWRERSRLEQLAATLRTISQ